MRIVQKKYLWVFQLALKNKDSFSLGFRGKEGRNSRQKQAHAQVHRDIIQHGTFMKCQLALEQTLQRREQQIRLQF